MNGNLFVTKYTCEKCTAQLVLETNEFTKKIELRILSFLKCQIYWIPKKLSLFDLY